jgi:hypothetical protein
MTNPSSTSTPQPKPRLVYSIGRAPSIAPVLRARDVLLIPASDADGDGQTHPPVEVGVCRQLRGYERDSRSPGNGIRLEQQR